MLKLAVKLKQDFNDIFYARYILFKIKNQPFSLFMHLNCSDSIFFTNNKITKLILDYLQQFKLYRAIVELL